MRALLEGHVDTTDWVTGNPADAKTAANQALGGLPGGKALKTDVLDRTWSGIEVTDDPVASSLKKSADDAVAVGLLKPVDLKGIYDLRLLREVLAARGARGSVDGAGLAAG